MTPQIRPFSATRYNFEQISSGNLQFYFEDMSYLDCLPSPATNSYVAVRLTEEETQRCKKQPGEWWVTAYNAETRKRYWAYELLSMLCNRLRTDIIGESTPEQRHEWMQLYDDVCSAMKG